MSMNVVYPCLCKTCVSDIVLKPNFLQFPQKAYLEVVESLASLITQSFNPYTARLDSSVESVPFFANWLAESVYPSWTAHANHLIPILTLCKTWRLENWWRFGVSKIDLNPGWFYYWSFCGVWSGSVLFANVQNVPVQVLQITLYTSPDVTATKIARLYINVTWISCNARFDYIVQW